jgi:prolyl-tRNA editing enzyme YbaK/EbsC (Cys-tRNA(Pro) deacylase)
MAFEDVRAFFRERGLEDQIREFDTSSATVELAAQALGCEGARIAKSIAFRAGDRYILVVTAGDTKIDNAKYKNRFGVKAKMLSAEYVPEATGHAVGGVCPFGVPAETAVYLDESMRRFESLFPACGSSNSCIELTIAQLEEFTGFEAWVDVCKLPNQ